MAYRLAILAVVMGTWVASVQPLAALGNSRRDIPVLSRLPVVGSLFVFEEPRQGVPLLKDLPVLGRLFRIENESREERIPVLSEIPIVGNLFRT